MTVPPQDLETERCVLGCVMAHNQSMDEISPLVSAESFYSDAHRKIFEAMRAMYDRAPSGIDIVTLRNELSSRGHLVDAGGEQYLLKIAETVPHAAHAEYYSKVVRQKYLKRQLIEICEDSLRRVHASHDEAAEDLFSEAEQRIYRVLEVQSTGSKIDIGDLLEATFERIFDRMDNGHGIPTGLANLDKILSGFHPSELIILAARPSVGKTALACNLTLHLAKNGTGALLFSLEQSSLELSERLLCIHTKTDSHRLRQGLLDEFEQNALMEGAGELRTFPLCIDDQPGVTVSRITAIARRMKRQKNIGVIVIDYLQLIEAENDRLPREQQVAAITRRLKRLAKELNVPVVALAQLSRAVEAREDKRPRLSDLRESGAIEQDADIVMFLHREDAFDANAKQGDADLIVAKNRSGPVGTAHLVWMKEQLRFADRSIYS